MLERLAQEIAIAVFLGLMIAQLAAWPIGLDKVLGWLHLPTRPTRLVSVAAVVGATRCLLHAATAGEALRPLPISPIALWLALAGGAIGLALRSGEARTGAEARAAAVVGASTAALAVVVVQLALSHLAVTGSIATAFALTGLAGSLWLRVSHLQAFTAAARRTRVTLVTDPATVLKYAGLAGILAATATVPSGVRLPIWALLFAAFLPVRDLLFAVRVPGLDQLSTWTRDVADRLDRLMAPLRAAERRVQAARLAGIPAGVAVGSAWWFIAMAGFMLEDDKLGLTLSSSAALQPLDQAGWAVGLLLLGSVVSRFEVRWLFTRLAVFAAVATAAIGLTSNVGVIRIAAVVMGFCSIAAPVGVVALLGRNSEERKKVGTAWSGSWLLTAGVVQAAELAVAWAWDWRWAAALHVALLLGTAPLFLVMPSLTRVPENPFRVWFRTLGLLGDPRVRRGAMVWFLSGGMYGLVASIYSPLLGDQEGAAWAALPLIGVVFGALATKWWGRRAERNARRALVGTAIVSAATYVPGVLLFGIPAWVAAASSVLILAIVLFVQNTFAEVGTSGTSAIGPAVLLPHEAAEENALTQTAKQAGAAALGFAASWLLGVERLFDVDLPFHVGLAPNVLGLVAGIVLVVLATVVPHVDHHPEPEPVRVP